MYLKGQGSWDSAFLLKVPKMIRNNPHSIRAEVTEVRVGLIVRYLVFKSF